MCVRFNIWTLKKTQICRELCLCGSGLIGLQYRASYYNTIQYNTIYCFIKHINEERCFSMISDQVQKQHFIGLFSTEILIPTKAHVKFVRI